MELNFDTKLCLQVLRVIDSLQLTAKFSVATPVNWQHGDKVMVTPNLSDEQAKEKVGFLPAKQLVLITIACCFHLLGGCMHNAEPAANVVWCAFGTYIMTPTGPRLVNMLLQFSKGFEKKEVPSGKGYIRLTPQPNA